MGLHHLQTNAEERIKNLEQLLDNERERGRVLESQLNANRDAIPRPTISENERARLREIDVLKCQVSSLANDVRPRDARVTDWTKTF